MGCLQNRRPDYIETFVEQLINWNKVSISSAAVTVNPFIPLAHCPIPPVLGLYAVCPRHFLADSKCKTEFGTLNGMQVSERFAA